MIIIFSASGKQKPLVWYVDEELQDKWAQILTEIAPSKKPAQIKVWDGSEIPAEAGILISTKPWETAEENVKVFHRLSWELEYDGAHVLALDPWMIFNKHTNPPLTYSRIFTDRRGRGTILIPGRDTEELRAWTSRFIQEKPGSFPAGSKIWQDWETELFNIGLFSSNMRGYDWYAVLFRLMSNEQTWIYAPLSKIRGIKDQRKSILEAQPFPESGNEASMLAKILWARPIKTKSKKTSKLIDDTVSMLKKAETQTIIADNMEWIPADPYGTPYDPISLSSHRTWLTTVWIYSIYN